MQRRKWASVIGFVALFAALSVWLGPDLVRWARYEKRWARSVPTTARGPVDLDVITVEWWDRWDRELFPHETRSWSIATGFMQMDVHDGDMTMWNFDGTVSWQSGEGDGEGEGQVRDEAPWRWGAQDQSMPSAPWLAADLTAEEWWESVKPE